MKKNLSDRQLWERSITEEDVLGACRNLLELRGARVYRVIERIPYGKRTSEPGIPDLFGWWPKHHSFIDPTGGNFIKLGPLHFFIEVKRPGGTLRPTQESWIAKAQRDGVISFMADSVEMMIREFAKWGIKL